MSDLHHSATVTARYCVGCDAIFGPDVRGHDHCEPVALVTVAQLCDLTSDLTARTLASVS